MSHDRFSYRVNVERSGTYRDYTGGFWPPEAGYTTVALPFAADVPDLGPGFREALDELGVAVDDEWAQVKRHGAAERTRFRDPAPIAAALRRVLPFLPDEGDRRALALRAKAVESGYRPEALADLAGIEEDLVVVAGQIATWYGKDTGGFPTAFAARRDDERQAWVTSALAQMDDVPAYLRDLNTWLRLGELPAFGATRLFFMAGEGDLHPKHIAYFLPEDEGVKRSPFKKTYYFGNTHEALLRSLSGPLAARFLDAGTGFDPEGPHARAISTLGVLGHEFGHAVHRETTRYRPLNAAHRWASVTLQEVLADVFGALIVAEVWAPRLGLTAEQFVSYYLAECVRYVSRGLGSFPDSDGMYLQLSYFVQLGALGVDERTGRLHGDPQAVLAGLRSLARVLADAVLDGRAEPAVDLFQAYGPPDPAPLRAFVDNLAGIPSGSVEYVHATRQPATSES